MARQNLLVIHGDVKSLRILEISLKRAGFNVTTAVGAADALCKLDTISADLIIAHTRSADLDAFAVRADLLGDPDRARIPWIFLGPSFEPDLRKRALELRVEDYIGEPFSVREVVVRGRLLLDRTERARLSGQPAGPNPISGSLADLGLVDLLDSLAKGESTGTVLVLGAEGRQGSIYLRGGKIIDAEAGRIRGETAVYKLLTFSAGRFEFKPGPVACNEVIQLSAQGLILEGLRYIDEWNDLVEQIPAPDAVYQIDYFALGDRLGEIPDEVNEVLRLLDGKRSLSQVLDACSFTDLEALRVVAKLYFEGIISSQAAELATKESPQSRLDMAQIAAAWGEPPVDSPEPPKGSAEAESSQKTDDEKPADANFSKRSQEGAVPLGRITLARVPASAVRALHTPLPPLRERKATPPPVLQSGESASPGPPSAPPASVQEQTGPVKESKDVVAFEIVAEAAALGPAEPPPVSFAPEGLVAGVSEGYARNEWAIEIGPSVVVAPELLQETTSVVVPEKPVVRKRMVSGLAKTPTVARIPHTARIPRVAWADACAAVFVFVLVWMTGQPVDPIERVAPAAAKGLQRSTPQSEPATTVVAGPGAGLTGLGERAGALNEHAPTVWAGANQPVNLEGTTSGRPRAGESQAAPEQYKQLVRQARRLYRRGYADQAGQLAQKALALDASGDEAMVLLANSELDRGHPTEAMALAEQAISANPQNPDAYLLKGAALQQKGHRGEAKRYYKKYLEIAPAGEYASDCKALLETL